MLSARTVATGRSSALILRGALAMPPEPTECGGDVGSKARIHSFVHSGFDGSRGGNLGVGITIINFFFVSVS